MNTDDCFRLFLLNTTNDAQLAAFLDQTANHILGPFPAGLSTDAGLVVANPVFGDDPAYARNFTSADYHGTVVWSWQLAMMAAGLERQLDRCQAGGGGAYGCHAATLPAFCRDSGLRTKVIAAYNHLWDLIEANRANLSNEVWSWRYQGGKFAATPLGAFSATESDIVQLWSLTFLAVRRNEPLR
ncbi:hypothetical protein VTK73DRAFT_1368 [Phialemonium thermophilum]|uniref:Uncharacterized protein n=1 Tax=Phialemonium thermophilum TaxID=223376 RepID=A0ABR3X9W6_9PEZI